MTHMTMKLYCFSHCYCDCRYCCFLLLFYCRCCYSFYYFIVDNGACDVFGLRNAPSSNLFAWDYFISNFVAREIILTCIYVTQCANVEKFSSYQKHLVKRRRFGNTMHKHFLRADRHMHIGQAMFFSAGIGQHLLCIFFHMTIQLHFNWIGVAFGSQKVALIALNDTNENVTEESFWLFQFHHQELAIFFSCS